MKVTLQDYVGVTPLTFSLTLNLVAEPDPTAPVAAPIVPAPAVKPTPVVE